VERCGAQYLVVFNDDIERIGANVCMSWSAAEARYAETIRAHAA
jgi:hypothetical protein